MSWAVGEDRERERFIGYGVPATCDNPGCGASIDRGMAYACGGGVTSSQENCGLFFCDKHLFYPDTDDAEHASCMRCCKSEDPFDPTPDVAEWVEHLLTDESWQSWREENPVKVATMRGQV